MKATGMLTVIAAAEKLMDAVTFDVSGVDGRGGNSWLTSTETVRASDELRLAISRFREQALGTIDETTADTLKALWEEIDSGVRNASKVSILGEDHEMEKNDG